MFTFFAGIGVRQLNLSYAKIPLAEVAKKLQLDSAEDAEYIVAKVCVIHLYVHLRVGVYEGICLALPC